MGTRDLLSDKPFTMALYCGSSREKASEDEIILLIYSPVVLRWRESEA